MTPRGDIRNLQKRGCWVGLLAGFAVIFAIYLIGLWVFG